MKNIFKNIGSYFTRLYRAIFSIKDPETILLTKEEEFYSFLEENKDRIKYLMEFNGKPNDETKILREKAMKVDNKKKFKLFRPIKISKKLSGILNKGVALDRERNELLDKKFTTTSGNILGDKILDEIENRNKK
jgi:hypothetical protein